MAKMWAGRASGETNQIADDFNSSIRFDCRMYRQDIRGSMAHAAMLGARGIITPAEAEQLIDGLYAILSGCMEDEFQQRVYENPDMTLEDMNAVYLQLAEEYGFAELYGYTGTEWAAIPHSFQSPMYYISYAVSMIAAMEIWELSEKDYDAARDVYLTILCRPANSKFRTLATENGLKDPVSPETVQSLAKTVSKALSN